MALEARGHLTSVPVGGLVKHQHRILHLKQRREAALGLLGKHREGLVSITEGRVA